YSNEYYTKTGADGILTSKLRDAIVLFDKKQIEDAAESTFKNMPEGRLPVVFIENRDTKRFATVADGSMAKMKAGAALNMLMGGTPLVYYGQEIGMKGEPVKDAGDPAYACIPEAFEWYAGETGQGMAVWYKASSMKPNDGISVEEQDKDKASLWSFYHELIWLRKKQPTLAT